MQKYYNHLCNKLPVVMQTSRMDLLELLLLLLLLASPQVGTQSTQWYSSLEMPVHMHGSKLEKMQGSKLRY